MMSTPLLSSLKHALLTQVKEAFPEAPSDFINKITLEACKEEGHGELATNAAMVLAKPLGQPPKILAEQLTKKFLLIPEIASAESAGPGFINLRLIPNAWTSELRTVLAHPGTYGNSSLGLNQHANVEYVSVNPTGPMHAGHGRVAVVGDAVAALFEKAGYKVTREFYINDAGGQIDVLARSLYLRYLEALGHKIGEIPPGLYPGEYLIPVGQKLAEEVGSQYVNEPEDIWLPHLRPYSVRAMMDLIKTDLHRLNIHHDLFTSELSIIQSPIFKEAFNHLTQQDLVFQGVLEKPKGIEVDDWTPEEQLLFKSTAFGDDADRVLQKANGEWTYFGKDVAYHLDKWDRTRGILLNVWGSDHAGHVKRTKSAVTAVTKGEGKLEVLLCQMVTLLDQGQPLKMSKRSGTFVTLEDVVDRVGSGPFRLFMLMRKNDAPMEFDFAKVLEKSADNPVFYIQYAHARIASVLRHAADLFGDLSDIKEADFLLLQAPPEKVALRLLAQWPRVVETAAQHREPHRIGFYLHDLAAALHSLWAAGKEDTHLRFIQENDRNGTFARLGLLKGIQNVLREGLELLGVEPVEEMR